MGCGREVAGLELINPLLSGSVKDRGRIRSVPQWGHERRMNAPCARRTDYVGAVTDPAPWRVEIGNRVRLKLIGHVSYFTTSSLSRSARSEDH